MDKTNVKYYEINEVQARRAKAMWSFSDYVDGSETESYHSAVDEVYALCEDAPEERKEKAMYYADMYAKKLAENINKGFEIELRCPSIMIAGGSNFPVAKKEKQNAARNRNFEEHKRIEGYIEKIKNLSNVSSAIKSSDENALELLKRKVEQLTARQAYMKEANSHFCSHKTMRSFADLTREQADELDNAIKNNYWGCPFPPFELTNNNAKIKSAKERVEQLSKVKTQENTEIQHELFRAVRNTDLMRLQLFFEGKLSAEVRCVLKANGFRWAPSQDAWQRQLTNNAIYAYRQVVKELEVKDG